MMYLLQLKFSLYNMICVFNSYIIYCLRKLNSVVSDIA